MSHNLLIRYNEELLKLSLHHELDEGDSEKAYRIITSEVSRILRVDRVSIWLYQESDSILHCVNLFLAETQQHRQGMQLHRRDFPDYFDALTSSRVIAAESAANHSATKEFQNNYLKENNIVSMLDGTIRMNGKPIGVICAETVGRKRKWSLPDITFMGIITDMITRAIQAKERASALHELEAVNLELERIVAHKSAELIQEKSRSLHSAKMASLGEMAGGIAHEINNPLTILRTYIELMLEEIKVLPLNPTSLESSLTRMNGTTHRIEKVIRGLRFFARDAKEEKKEIVCIESIIEETLPLCQEKFIAHGYVVNLHFEKPGLMICCQPVSISQSILNLLNNAYDALIDTPSKTISIDCIENCGNLEVRIKDSGPGISDDLRDRIMQPFFTTKAVGKGTGLGLPIVKGIIEQHQGHFFLDDNSEHTCFVMSIPLANTNQQGT